MAIIHDSEFTALCDGAGAGRMRFIAWDDAGDAPAFPTIEELIAGGDPSALEPPDEAGRIVILTSGTTGTPKGALSTQRAVCQSLMNFDCQAMASAMINPEAIGAMMKKGFPPTQLLAVPLFHVSGCHAVFLTSLRGGRRIVIMYKWDVEPALRLIQDEKVTGLTSVPTIVKKRRPGLSIGDE